MQVVFIINKASSTVKDELDRMQVPQYVEDNQHALRRLKNLGTIRPTAAKVAMVKISVAARLMKNLSVAAEVIEEVRRLGQAEPPAVRHHVGGLDIMEPQVNGKQSRISILYS